MQQRTNAHTKANLPSVLTAAPHRSCAAAGGGAIIANPNCSTIIALMAVTPLHKVAKVKRMIVSTYQAASGAGAAAMEELKDQTRDVLEGKEAKPVIFPYQVLLAWRVWH
jgi:aspartate-semialdehyde dehydrogenase